MTVNRFNFMVVCNSVSADSNTSVKSLREVALIMPCDGTNTELCIAVGGYVDSPGSRFRLGLVAFEIVEGQRQKLETFAGNEFLIPTEGLFCIGHTVNIPLKPNRTYCIELHDLDLAFEEGDRDSSDLLSTYLFATQP